MDNKYEQQFKRGAYEMIMLCLIAQKETYGYEIITKLNERGGNIFGYAREGTVYPILYRLQKDEFIKYRLVPARANGREKKYYSLTPKGVEALKEIIEFWNQYRVCVDSFIQVTEDLL